MLLDIKVWIRGCGEGLGLDLPNVNQCGTRLVCYDVSTHALLSFDALLR